MLWRCVCAMYRCGLNATLIEWFAATRGQPELQQLIATLLQVTGAYSISGQAMPTLLATMRSSCSCGGHDRYSSSLNCNSRLAPPRTRML